VSAMRTASRLNSSLCIAAISGLLDGEYCSQKTGTKPVQVQPVRRRAGAASRDRTVDDGRREVGRAGNRPEDDETRPRYPLTYRSKASFSAPFHRASAPRRPSETNRRRGMDEDRPQRGRHQRSGGVRRRDQPLYRTRPRHLPLRRDAALQGQRQHHGTDTRVPRANGTTEIHGSMGEISGGHVTLATALWLQTMVPLMAGDTVDCRDTSAPRAATLPPFTRSSVAARSGIGGRM